MATFTGGTTTTTALPFGLTFKPGYGSGMSAADIATMASKIKDDLGNAHSIIPESFSANGRLYIPNRGIITMLPGDVVFVDPTGWPILVSKNAINIGGTVWNT